jgi:hypothetical protein
MGLGLLIMKIIKILLVLASLVAIAGAAFFQLFVLLADACFATPLDDRPSSTLA